MVNQAERRKHPRFKVPATINVARGREYLGTYPAVDVSRGGALISGGPEVDVGETVRIQVCMPAQDPIECRAKIVRQAEGSDGRPAFGLAFDLETAGVEEQMARALRNVLNLVSSHKDRSVLVVDSCCSSRAGIARALNALGRSVLFANDAADALQVLGQPGSSIDLVLVDLRLGADEIHALMQHLESQQPGAKRVIMSDRLTASELVIWASSTNAQDILPSPLDPRRLARLAMTAC